MRLAFIDIAAAYTAHSVYETPLGGTQSAVCYLAAELAKKGAAVTLVNQSREEIILNGVSHAAPEKLDGDVFLNGFDAFILNGRWTEKLARNLKKRTDKPLVAWMHEATFAAPFLQPLLEFSAFIFVSRWQKKMNAHTLPPASRHAIIANGVAPSFHNLFKKDESVLAAKYGAPIAVYSGSSKRGLLDLPEIIPALHAALPDMRFEIYSDCVVSREEADTAAFKRMLLNLPNVDHVGALTQNELAQRFRRAHFFLSPNAYPETFCIALAESMSAGVTPITTARAALPETAAGFAEPLPDPDPDNLSWLRGSIDIRAFADHAARIMRKPLNEEKLKTQIAYTHAHYNWAHHANTWLDFLKTL